MNNVIGYHYSNKPNLNCLSLDYSGQGIKGEEEKRRKSWPQFFIPRIYLYDSQNRKEPGLGNYCYQVELTNLYQLPIKSGCKISRSIHELAQELYPGDTDLFFTLFENVITYGYNGVYNPQTGVISYFRNIVLCGG